MMQHVATAKSEVAAFATSEQTNSYLGSESNEQFGKLLQDQKPNNSVASAFESAQPQTSNKKGLQQPTEETKNKITKVNEEQISTSPTKKTPNQGNDDSVIGVETGKNNIKNDLYVGNPKAESQLQPNETESELVVESTDVIVPEEWVSLIDSLTKLADNPQINKRDLAEPDTHVVDASAADLKLPNKIDEELFEQIADRQIADLFKIPVDDTSLPPVEDRKVAVNLSQDGKVQDEQTLIAIEKLKQTMSMFVDEVLTNSEKKGLEGIDIQQKAAELLLEQPEALQNFINQLQVITQKSGSDTIVSDISEQKTLDLTPNKVVKEDSLLASKQIEKEGQADLTLVENKALLRTLLIDSEIDNARVQEPVKLANPILSDTPEKAVKTQQIEVLEQNIQMVQTASNDLLNTSNVDAVASNKDIKNLLSLTDTKLDKVLENIAQRIFDSKNVGETISPEQIAQQIVIPKSAEIISSVESSSKDFVSALKSGLEEFKNQLSLGREPGIDLKALVSEALAKMTDTGAVAKAPANLEQMVNSVSQVLDFAQTMNRAIEHHHDQAYSATLRDVAQIQGEQSKQIQLNQFESKFEKAINIAKPEGHQQLAEKVRWMVNTKNLVADIRLDPAELGSVHVRVAVSGESATVNFVVQSQQARDAVDTATPKLREMLAEKGIELGQSSVRQESDSQQGQGDGESAKQGRNGDVDDIEVPEQVIAQQNIVNGAIGGIDYFV
jgi:flagellar hook-length control protein FliK